MKIFHCSRLRRARRPEDAQQQSQQGNYRTHQREPIAVTSVESRALLQRICCLQLSALVARSLGYHASQRVNHRRNASVGIAQQPAIIFHRAHACLVQVLPWRASLAVPTVVRDVDEQLSTVLCELPDFIRKDRLVTEKRADLRGAHFQWGAAICRGRNSRSRG